MDKPNFHVDDEFEVEMVAIDLETLTSVSLDQLTGSEIKRRLVVPKALEASTLAHIKKLRA